MRAVFESTPSYLTFNPYTILPNFLTFDCDFFYSLFEERKNGYLKWRDLYIVRFIIIALDVFIKLSQEKGGKKENAEYNKDRSSGNSNSNSNSSSSS